MKELILIEHRRAELQRLDLGMDGCGCSDCQELYKTLDLTRYGSRVIRIDGIVTIKEKSRKKPDSENALTDNQPLPDEKQGVTKIKDDKRLLPDTQQGDNGIMLRRRGRPQKPDGEPVSRMTLYRRSKKQSQVALL